MTTPILPDEFGCSAITTPRLRDGLRGPVGPPGVQEALHQWPTLAALAAPTLAALAALALYQWPASGGLGGANFGNFGLSSGLDVRRGGGILFGIGGGSTGSSDFGGEVGSGVG